MLTPDGMKLVDDLAEQLSTEFKLDKSAMFKAVKKLFIANQSLVILNNDKYSEDKYWNRQPDTDYRPVIKISGDMK